MSGRVLFGAGGEESAVMRPCLCPVSVAVAVVGAGVGAVAAVSVFVSVCAFACACAAPGYVNHASSRVSDLHLRHGWGELKGVVWCGR